MKTLKSIMVMTLLISAMSGCTKKEEPEPSTLKCKSVGYTYDLDALTYSLAWSDEFDGTTINKDNWFFETGGSGWGNNELQYYTDGLNASVKDGLLDIEARKETYNNLEYTSARMVSRGKQDFLYGKIEVYAQMPKTKGTWAAIWMMPQTSAYGGWPSSGEIDILETVGYAPDRIYGTIHTAVFNHKKGSQKGYTAVLDQPEAFHLYTIEWLPDQIRYYVDGVFKFRFAPGIFLDCPTSAQWPFDRTFYFVLNVAVGGDWGGAQGVAEEGWPQHMLIDYVRVYQIDQLDTILATKK